MGDPELEIPNEEEPAIGEEVNSPEKPPDHYEMPVGRANGTL